LRTVNLPLAGGLIQCSHCGQSIAGEQIRKKLKDGRVNEHVYYRCGNDEKSQEHPPVRINGRALENQIENKLAAGIAKRVPVDANGRPIPIVNGNSRMLTPKVPEKKTLVEMRQLAEWTIEIHSFEDDGYQAKGFLSGKERFTVGGETIEGTAACAVKVCGELKSLYKM